MILPDPYPLPSHTLLQILQLVNHYMQCFSLCAVVHLQCYLLFASTAVTIYSNMNKKYRNAEYKDAMYSLALNFQACQ